MLGLGLRISLSNLLESSTRIPAWVLSSNGILPVADYDFKNGLYLGPTITTTRSSTAYTVGPDGRYVSVPANTSRIEYIPDPNVLERQNFIRNNSMQGALIGTPGILPTIWTYSNTATGSSGAVVGIGTENDIDYLDIRINGTITSAGNFQVVFEPAGNINAFLGQTWTTSLYTKIISGSSTNVISTNIVNAEYQSTTFVAQGTQAFVLQNSSTPLISTRVSGTRTITSSNTTSIRPSLSLALAVGNVDITIRIGLPQLELGSTASAPIRTTGSIGIVGPGNIGCRGVLVEGAQTNYIRNNAMVGATVSSGPTSAGTNPTNWSGNLGGTTSSPISGITQNYTFIGTDRGMDVVELAVSGTTTFNITSLIQFDGSMVTAATPGQLWTGSIFYRIVSGDVTSGGNAQLTLTLREYDSAGAFLRQTLVNMVNTGNGYLRAVNSVTIGTGTAYIALGIRLSVATSGIPINFTIRIGWPQLEIWSPAVTTVGGASSPIRTTNGIVTRAADNVTSTLSTMNSGATVTSTYSSIPNFSGLSRCLFYLSDGTSGNALFYRSANGVPVNGVPSFNSAGTPGSLTNINNAVPIDSGSRHTIAYAAKTNDYAYSFDGNVVSTQTVGGGLPGLKTLEIGYSAVNPLGYLFGYIERITVWPARLSNAELQRLSIPSPDIDYNFKTNKYSGSPITVTRSSSAYIDDSAGNWTLVPANTLRRSDKGVLIEGAQTNLFVWSTEYDNDAWAKNALTVTPNTGIGYDQANTADSIFPTTTNAEHYLRKIVSVPAGSLNTFSVFVKANGSDRIQLRFLGQQTTSAGGAARFNLTTGTSEGTFTLGTGSSSITSGMQRYGDYWRVWISGIVNSTDTGWICDHFMMQPTGGSNNTAFAGNTSQGLTIWGSQLETWNATVTTVGGPSSPIRTSGTAATRAADVLSTTLGNVIGSSATLAVVGQTPSYAVSQATIMRLGSTTDSIILRRNGTGQALLVQPVVGGTSQTLAAITGTLADSTRFAASAAMATSDEVISVNGSVIVSAAPASTPTGMSSLLIGAGASNPWFGYIERLVVWPVRLPNTNIQTMSTLSYWGG